MSYASDEDGGTLSAAGRDPGVTFMGFGRKPFALQQLSHELPFTRGIDTMNLDRVGRSVRELHGYRSPGAG